MTSKRKIFSLLFISSCILINNMSLYSYDYIKITNSIYSETDAELVINPKNPANLISSSLQHKYSYGKDNFLNAISYSFDKGLTWERYQNEVLPNEDYRIMIEGKDNTLFFSSDGIAHSVWTNTLVKTGIGGNDSIIQLINYHRSTDGGKTWLESNENFGRINSNYDVSKSFNGLKENFRYLTLFEYDNSTYISYSLQKLSTDGNDMFVLFDVNTPENKYYIPLPDSLYYLGNYDIKIKDNIANIAFVSSRYFLTIEYMQFDLVTQNIIKSEKIASISIAGTTLLPYVMSYILPGFPPDKIDPKPLINFINGEVIVSWYGNEVSETMFNLQKNNIFISKQKNGTFTKPKKVFPDSVNHQMLYDLKINDNNVIAIDYYNLNGPFENFDYDVSLNFLFSKDGGESFTTPFTFTSDYSLLKTKNKNFNYGIGYRNCFAIDNENIYLSWVDGSENNGNTEIVFNTFPVNFDYSNTNINLLNLSVSNLYPNPFQDDIKAEIFNDKIQKIKIEMYDINGKFVRLLFNDVVSFGKNTINLKADNLVGGDYFLICKSDESTIFKKIIKIK